jgi:hypothetical protein
VLTVADALTATTAPFPDTLLGIRDQFGTVYHIDDNGSPVGDGFASGAGGLQTNSGEVSFSVTGYADFDFVGTHSESGQYEVFVEVYDFFGDPVDEFSEVRTLGPGVVHNFSYSDFEWLNGDYNVYIDNTVGAISDVDFFTFTGLTVGAQFIASTVDPASSGIDTFLGWFDSGGSLQDSDDDGAGGTLSRIEGAVPAGGQLTFAVTGFGDDNFAGSHAEEGTYELRLQIQSAPVPGDYNNNGRVDAADYALWRKGGPLANEVDNPGTVNVADYTAWRARFGNPGSGSGSGAGSGDPRTTASAAVPEPAGLLLLVIATALCFSSRHLRFGIINQ